MRIITKRISSDNYIYEYGLEKNMVIEINGKGWVQKFKEYKKIILSRKNILRRDGHRCQFCGRGDLPLTVDHVLPRSRGGEDTWENLVCACVQCNNAKGDRTPEEARMPLMRRASRPNHVTFIRHFVGNIDDRWKPYLFMN